MTYEYPAVFSRQRMDASPLMASFVAPAGEIEEWAQVERLKSKGSGFQRLRNESKVRAIHRFLAQDERNMIPTAIVVALTLPDIANAPLGECSRIVIPRNSETPPGLVIDGQHRLYGTGQHDPTLPLNVVALINASDEEIAFQFLVINSKASKMPTDHVQLLALHYQEGPLADRLKTARMVLGRHTFVGVVDSSPDSPFHKSVIWPTESTEVNSDRTCLVLPASIEHAIAVIQRKNLPELANDDSLLEFFFTLWTAVKERWAKLWIPESKLLQKVGVVAMTTFVIDDLVPLSDRGDINWPTPTPRVPKSIRTF